MTELATAAGQEASGGKDVHVSASGNSSRFSWGNTKPAADPATGTGVLGASPSLASVKRGPDGRGDCPEVLPNMRLWSDTVGWAASLSPSPCNTTALSTVSEGVGVLEGAMALTSLSAAFSARGVVVVVGGVAPSVWSLLSGPAQPSRQS